MKNLAFISLLLLASQLLGHVESKELINDGAWCWFSDLQWYNQ